MVAKWNRSHISLLIKLYEEQPLLYDMKSPHYFNRKKREAALLAIASKLSRIRKTTVRDVKAKIKTLRSQFTAEKSLKKRRMESEEMYVPTLWCYDSLKFLDKHIGKRKIPSCLKEILINQGIPDEDYSPSMIESSLNQNSNESTDSSYNNDESLVKYEMDFEQEERNMPVDISAESNRTYDYSTDVVFEQAKAALTLAKSMILKEDRYDILGKYIASEMRRVTDEQIYFDTKMALEGIVNDAQRRQRMLDKPIQSLDSD